LIFDYIKNKLRGSKRNNKYIKNIVYIIISQFFGILISLLLVPITLNYLGVKEYGVWITLTSIMGWFVFFDIGLGHGLRNKYAEAKAKQEHNNVKNYVSTAFFGLITISLTIFIIFIAVYPFINWASVLNAPKEMESQLKILALIVIGSLCIRFIVNIVNILLTADQEPATPLIIGLAGNLLSLIVVYLVTILFPPSLLHLGIALSLSQLFPLIIAFFYFFATRYKPIFPSLKYFSKSHIRNIFSLGIRFFAIQITALILLQTNSIIIAHVAGLEEVTKFNIAFKYINILFLAFSAFLTPLWSAITEAYAKGEILWIRNSIRRLNQIWLLMIFGGVVLVVSSPFLYHLWLGNTLFPDFKLLVLLLFYIVCLCKSLIYRNFMNGVGKISLQFFVTILQSIMHIPIAYLLGRFWGIYGVVIVMASWALINAIWEPIQFNRIINRTAKGIWAR
jgi:O-antigen/teichoic acid export membrane protein